MYKFAYSFVLAMLLTVCAFAQESLSPADVVPQALTKVSAASFAADAQTGKGLAKGLIVSVFGDKIATSNSVTITFKESF